MRELIFVLIALSLPTLAMADGYSYYPQDYTLIPPSPEVGSLLKYNEIEVDNFTGIPNISFELFRLNCGRITIPITLSYHGGGIRNDDKEGNAGLGWNVLASACISREVQGAPDESTSHIKGLFHLDSTALSFNMEKRRQSPLPHLWRMGHFFFVLYVSILSFSQKACFCHF